MRVVRDDQLVAVVLQRPGALRRAGVVGTGLVDDRPQPEEGKPDRNEGGGEGRRPLAPQPWTEQGVAHQWHEQEKRVRRMYERERPEYDREREPGDPAGRGEEERDRGRHVELARRRSRLRELRERAAMAGPEGEQREGGEERRAARCRRSEHRDPGFPRERACKGREHRGAVTDHFPRVDAGDPRDERDEPVPERERIAGMKPAVLELVDRPQVQVAELDELAHARLVEQPVAGDRPGNAPEEPAEDDPDQPGPWRSARQSGHTANRVGDDSGDEDRGQDDPGEPDVRVDGEDDRPRDEHGRGRPGEERRGRALPQRPRNGGPGGQHDDRAEDEPKVLGHPASSEWTSPEARNRAASRYTAPRSPRKAAPRRRSDQSSIRRARSASALPRCLAR